MFLLPQKNIPTRTQSFSETPAFFNKVVVEVLQLPSVEFVNALAMAGIEVLLITTSDLDISLLVHAENEDAAYEALKKAYEL